MVMVLFLLSACKTNEEPQSSPRIYMSYFTVTHQGSSAKADTLGVKTVGDTYVLDSISVGDTVRVDILLNAVTNTLNDFVFETDTNLIKYNFISYKELESALTGDSDLSKGIFYFKSGYNAASLPLFYIARKSGNANVSMKVSSDSKYSPSSLSFTQPVR